MPNWRSAAPGKRRHAAFLQQEVPGIEIPEKS